MLAFLESVGYDTSRIARRNAYSTRNAMTMGRIDNHAFLCLEMYLEATVSC